MSYSPIEVANTILHELFEKDYYIKPITLQKLIVIVAEKYREQTGNYMFDEPFLVWEYGPISRSVYDNFAPYRLSNSLIKRYGKNAMGKSHIVGDLFVHNIVRQVCNDLINNNKSLVELVDYVRRPEGDWYKAWQSYNKYISL